mgnify:CR=1 FL=1
MKILGIGVDLVKNQRIKLLIKKNNFIKRTFSKNEIDHFKKYRNNDNYYAKRFAAKESFSKAFGTIMDANITTLLVALILYAIGTGPIKGFAITLSIGIVTSIFTAILVTRGIVNIMYGYRKVERLNI